MQLVPPSPSANGSAKCRATTFGALALAMHGLRDAGPAASTGGSPGLVTGCADCCDDGCHIGMTCTTGGAASGTTGCLSCGGTGCAGLARSPSSQVSARAFRDAVCGRPSTDFDPSRRTCTTSTTLL